MGGQGSGLERGGSKNDTGRSGPGQDGGWAGWEASHGRGTDHRGPARTGLRDRDRDRRGYISTGTRLRERLSELAASGRPLAADLDQVSFIDSAGLAALVGAAKRAAAHGGSLRVVCARPQIRQLFRLTGLDGQIPLARTLDATLEALAATRTTPR